MIKAAIAICVLAAVSEARALRGLSSTTSCVELPPCSSSSIIINGVLQGGDSSVAAAVKACEASATCVTGKETTIDAASLKTGSCWTVFNGGTLTVAKGYTGTVVAARCGQDNSTAATAIIADGAAPSAVMNNGADIVVKSGASIGTLNGNGGNTNAEEGSSISAIKMNGGEVHGATSGVTSISMNGGNADLDMGAETAVKKVQLNGGEVDLTAKSVATLSLMGGDAIIRKAAVADASTMGGSITLEDGATVTQYHKMGGSCTGAGCPKADADW